MDYSNFYHNWLQLDAGQNVEPNFYELLGLSNMEPDVQQIKSALNETLDRFQNVNGAEYPEAYSHILQMIFSARRTLLDPVKKHEYDCGLSQVTGQRVWRSYQRPSLMERLRQCGLIAVSFALGCVVMIMMAISVQRNPDGSIMFHEEVKVAKAEPFATQLDYVVYRPSIASDYQVNGYTAVSVNSEEKEAKEEFTISSDATKEELSSPESAEGEKTQDALHSAGLSESDDSKPATTEEEMNEFADILSDGGSNAPETESQAVELRPSPLYGKDAKTGSERSSSEFEVKEFEVEDSEVKNESGAVEDSLEKSDFPEKNTKKMILMPPVTENQNPQSFSLSTVMALLENVRKNMDFKTPGAEEAFSLLQFQTLHEVIQKLNDSNEKIEPEEAKKFTAYLLQTVTELGWEKHFDEAFQLCGMAEEFGKKNEIFEETRDAVAAKRSAVSNYQKLFSNAQQILSELKVKPDDPVLNTHYAMWLWQENGDLVASIPYLAKCQYSVIRRAANMEILLGKDKKLSTPQNVTQLGDYWWEVAERLKDKQQVNLVQEHAKTFYRQVEPTLLNDTQKSRIVNN